MVHSVGAEQLAHGDVQTGLVQYVADPPADVVPDAQALHEESMLE